MASRSGAEGVKVSKYSISCLRMIEKFGSTKILEVDCFKLQGCVRSENKPVKK